MLTQALTWTFIYFSLVSFLYLLFFGLLLLSTCLWSPSFIHLSLVSFLYRLVFGILHSSTYLWSIFLSTCLRSPPVHFSYVSSFYLLVFGLLPLFTCLWSPSFIHLSLVFFYVLLFGLLLSTYFGSPPLKYLSLVSSVYLLVFGLLPLSTCVWSPPFIFFCLSPPFIYLFLVFSLHLLLFGLFFVYFS